MTTNRRIVLASRPQGAASTSNFRLEEVPLPALAPATSVFGLIGFSGKEGREADQLALLEPFEKHYGDDWWYRTQLAFAQIELQKLDEVAYIRFASVYRRFQDLNEFREEIERLSREPAKPE